MNISYWQCYKHIGVVSYTGDHCPECAEEVILLSKFTQVSRRGSTQTYYRVKCGCGHINIFWALSWGGHGHLKCKGCSAKIYKRETLERANNRLHPTGAESPVPDAIDKDGRKLYYAKSRPCG